MHRPGPGVSGSLVQVRPLEGLWFSSSQDGKPLEDFEERSDLIWLRVLKAYTGSCSENGVVHIGKSREAS